jgi:hypothetical protein
LAFNSLFRRLRESMGEGFWRVKLISNYDPEHPTSHVHGLQIGERRRNTVTSNTTRLTI